MSEVVEGSRSGRGYRALVVVLLLLAAVGGTGVAAADGETEDASPCPAVVNERGSDHAASTAVERSSDGRSIALNVSGCT